MTHDDAVNLEAEFFAAINDPDFQMKVNMATSPDEFFYGWWFSRLNDILWSHELSDISNLQYAINMLGDIPIVLPGTSNIGEVLREGRENMVKVLERGGYDNGSV